MESNSNGGPRREREAPMSMRIDMTWQENDVMTFQASCADCTYTSAPYEDEEHAREAFHGHACD
jgi:hypothetical protein